MDQDELAAVRAGLEEYVGQVFASFPRKDQRTKGRLYLQGLMLDGRRKSMQPMGERLDVDYQQLQQFVSSSPWTVEPVRRQLGKVGNCRIAVSVHAATDAASCPLNWRLYVPEAWDDTCADTNEDAERTG